MYVPSAITVWCLTLHGGMAGRMFRHHALRLRGALESPFASHADREARPSGQPGNASSCLPRSASRWRMTPVGEHVTHIHRWVPALVLPFRFIAAPHAGRLFALLDFVLMASSPPPELPFFSARKNDTPTRLLPQDQTQNISNTFVPVARFHRGA